MPDDVSRLLKILSCAIKHNRLLPNSMCCIRRRKKPAVVPPQVSSFLTKSTLAKLVDLQAKPLQFKQDPAKFLRLSPSIISRWPAVSGLMSMMHILDIVSRQGAGTGSMNLQRYYLLVGPQALLTAGQPAAADLALCHVVEAKQQRRSAPLYFFADLDPVNQLNDAHLTVDCQRLMQRRPDLVLDEHYFAGAHYLVRSLHHANVDLDPVDICLHPTAPGQQLLDYASACADALALAHSRGDRRSVRFEQAVAATLPAQAGVLLQLCQQYAEQMRLDCRLLAELLASAAPIVRLQWWSQINRHDWTFGVLQNSRYTVYINSIFWRL